MADSNAPNSSLDDLSARAYEIAKRRQAAAVAVVTLLEDQYATWFESSTPTVLYGCAWLAGTSLYRSFEAGGETAPGSPAFTEKSNAEGLKLMKVFMFLVEKDGIKLKAEDFAADIPADRKPRKSIAEVQARFQKSYNEIMKAHEFDALEGARTGAVACARLMRLHCLNRKDIEPAEAASIVSAGFVEGVKTVPAPLDRESGSGPA